MIAGQWSEKMSRRTRCKKNWVRRCTRRRVAEVGGGYVLWALRAAGSLTKAQSPP